MNTQEVRDALGSGWTVREGRGCLWLRYGSRDAGRLVPGDDGTTGTCRSVTVRAGTVAEALRKAGVTVSAA